MCSRGHHLDRIRGVLATWGETAEYDDEARSESRRHRSQVGRYAAVGEPPVTCRSRYPMRPDPVGRHVESHPASPLPARTGWCGAAPPVAAPKGRGEVVD